MDWKLELARRITARWHGEEGARAGEEHFTRVVRQGEAPAEVPDATFEVGPAGTVYLPGVLQAVFGQSGSHWRRQIDQGGVRLNGDVASGYEHDPAALDGALVQAGKRQFVTAASRLTSGLALLLCPGCPRGQRRKIPASNHNGEP